MRLETIQERRERLAQEYMRRTASDMRRAFWQHKRETCGQ